MAWFASGGNFRAINWCQAITYALTSLLGERAGNLILVVVIISMLGVLNGLLLAGMRLPQAYAEKACYQRSLGRDSP